MPKDIEQLACRKQLAQTIRKLRSEGWTAVGWIEIRALWSKLKADGNWFNGCTNWGLIQIYGDKVFHLSGYGWLKQTRGKQC